MINIHLPNIRGIPNISHCTGEKKLLGENYGVALSEIFDISDSNIISKISELSILMRSYVVLDDFIRDNLYENDDIYQTIKENIIVLEKNIISNLNVILPNGESVWRKYLKIYNNTYLNYFSYSPFCATINKCNMILIPFEIITSLKPNEEISKYIKVISYYLFGLQLLDDFKDMDEDLVSKNNHNLFLSGLTSNNCRLIIDNRINILLPLLKYILYNFNYINSIVLKNGILKDYITGGIHWLTNKISKYKVICPSNFIFDGYFEYYNKTVIFKCINSTNFEKCHCSKKFDDISAEIIHNYKYNTCGVLI
ncbi:hypothetical protein D4R71_06760 [bacterium]|nr:MAG: hypothetical protein D4R71_06760 [bacterium]